VLRTRNLNKHVYIRTFLFSYVQINLNDPLKRINTYPDPRRVKSRTRLNKSDETPITDELQACGDNGQRRDGGNQVTDDVRFSTSDVRVDSVQPMNVSLNDG